MSTFKVEIVAVRSVMPHPNANRLDLVSINDWQCVAAKGNFQPGDHAIYFPIDSILPPEVEARIFGSDAKVKLSNSRVRTIKLRGAISQGLVVKPETFMDVFHPMEFTIGSDVTKLLGVTKYEPPVKVGLSNSGQAAPKRNTNPNFKKYGGIENAKNYPNVFEEGEEVVVTEKIHGSHIRAGWVPFNADTLFKKLKKFLGIAPTHEFVYGSNNVQLQNKLLYKGFYETNIYAEAVKKYNLKEILKPGEVIHGEVYGSTVQKGYDYDCKPGERKAIFFDLKKDDKFLDPVEFKHWARSVGLPVVPELYVGPFSKEKILSLRDGRSVLEPKQKIREGVVVKPLRETTCFIGRKMLKYISDNYLLKNQDDETIAH